MLDQLCRHASGVDESLASIDQSFIVDRFQSLIAGGAVLLAIREAKAGAAKPPALMPPAENRRDSGLVCGCQKPLPMPLVIDEMLVEPYRSAAAASTAPLVSLLTSFSAWLSDAENFLSNNATTQLEGRSDDAGVTQGVEQDFSDVAMGSEESATDQAS